MRLWNTSGTLAAVLLLAGAATAQQPAAPPALPSAPQSQLADPVPQSNPPVALPPARPVIPPPPTLHDRFNKYVHQTYQPGLLLPVLADTAYSHVTAAHNQFGSDAAGFGERLGASTAMTEFHLFLEHFVLATAFHQDPTFQPLHVGTARQRALYAVTRVGVARGDSGHPVFNYSLVISGFAGAALGNVFEPDERRSVGDTLGRALTGFASDAGMNLGREFWPEIRGVLRRHEPKPVQRVQDRVQDRIDKVGKRR